MSRLRYLAGSLTMLLGACVHAAEPHLIATQGETVIVGAATGLSLEVRLKTHVQQIGQPSDGRPSVIESSCTYSSYPCSLVDDLRISVDGRPLFIPRSAFCDLSDLTKLVIGESKEAATLTLYGGDASESYVVKIEVDKTHMRRRTVASALDPDEILQETIYHPSTLGD